MRVFLTGSDALHGARAAVVHAEQDVGPTADRRRRHRVRPDDRAHRARTAPPCRCGSEPPSARPRGAASSSIAENEEAWAARLEAVAGCCELDRAPRSPHHRPSRGWAVGSPQASRPTTPCGTSCGRCSSTVVARGQESHRRRIGPDRGARAARPGRRMLALAWTLGSRPPRPGDRDHRPVAAVQLLRPRGVATIRSARGPCRSPSRRRRTWRSAQWRRRGARARAARW